ncbi:MAG: hypothetical protein ACRENN_09075 [Candidatus Eiseniibacteriota bacterium]
MEGFLSDSWTMLVGRTTGPLTLRLILQPSVAAFLAIRAGLKDAREGRTPYLWAIFKDPAARDHLLHGGWKDIRKIFLMALTLDTVYQIIVFRWIYPLQAIIVAVILAVIPYVLLRGPVTRLKAPRPR